MNKLESMSLHAHEIWVLFPETDSLALEIRAIWPKGIKPSLGVKSHCFCSSNYEDLAAFRTAVETYVTQMNRQGFNMYATLNPLRLGLGLTQAASDSDITCRRRLLIDIDRDSGKEHPASDTELEAAGDLAGEIDAYLQGLGWPNPVRLISGNGHHLVYRLADLANSAEVTASIRDFLAILKSRFSRNGFSVDTSVSNASRVTKLPGTYVRRGTEIGNRLYRLARIYG